MKKEGFFLLIFIILLNMSCKENEKKNQPQPPVAEKIKKELTIHGDTRVDNYYWLRDRDSEEVLKYLNDENEYTEAMTEHTKKLQKELYEEIREMTPADGFSSQRDVELAKQVNIKSAILDKLQEGIRVINPNFNIRI